VNLGEILEKEEVGISNTVTMKKPRGIPTPLSNFSTAGMQVMASPLVKRMAAEKGIDLTAIIGSGPGGRIMAEDLDKAEIGGSIKSEVVKIPGNVVPLTSIRKVIAERMSLSSTTMAMVTLNSEIDVTPIVAYREELKLKEKEKDEIHSINAVLVSLTAKALREFPYLNASFEDKGIRLFDPVNIGLAVDTADGLIVIVIKNADNKSIDEIHKDIAGLLERAQTHKSFPEDLQGSTFTITNLGMYGVDSFNPIINPPESGILGVGRITENKLSKQNDFIPQYVATFSLTFDHRVIDGAPAARFLQRLGELITQL